LNRTFGECELELEQPAFPRCPLLARNATVPLLQVENPSILVSCGFGIEAEWVVDAPLLAEGR
jgi:hypothetical protein